MNKEQKELKKLKDKKKLKELKEQEQGEIVKAQRGELLKSDLYFNQPQNLLTNALIRIKTHGKDQFKKDELLPTVIKSKQITSVGDVEFLFMFGIELEENEYNNAVRSLVTDSTKMVLMFLLQQARLKLKPGENTFILKTADYARLRGLKDRKTARQQLLDGLKSLYVISINFKSSNNKMENAELWRIMDNVATVRGGAKVKLNEVTISMLNDPSYCFFMGDMIESARVPQIDFRYHAHSLLLSNYFSNLFHIRRSTTLEVGLDKVIDVADVPTLDEIAEGNRNIKQQRVIPVLKELENLNDIGAYEITYLNARTGKPVYDVDIDITEDFEEAANEQPLEDYDPGDIIVRVSYPKIKTE